MEQSKRSQNVKVKGKKAPMRTASDVINRILWDESLHVERFIVGYLDRFTGIQEKAFSAFSWEDIASVDYFTLAIPKHRIQYFKYDNCIVWDKRNRTDYVFGSTGARESLQEILEKASKLKKDDICEQHATYEGNFTSEDDFTVNLGVNCLNLADSCIMDETNDEFAENSKVSIFSSYLRKRPTHFLCVRITDSEILKTMGKVQDYILGKEPLYTECIMPKIRSHITLAPLGLDSQEDVALAVASLQNIANELSSLVTDDLRTITVADIATFDQRVLYAKVLPNDSFFEYVTLLRSRLSEEGIQIRDSYDYNPHVTILKVNRETGRKMLTKCIHSQLYEPFHGIYFGTQYIDSIYLCSMGEGRQEDGFYVTPCSINLDASAH